MGAEALELGRILFCEFVKGNQNLRDLFWRYSTLRPIQHFLQATLAQVLWDYLSIELTQL